jgi:hypothetical protein
LSLHADLVALGARWLRALGCEVVLAEPWVPRGERPDVIGWLKDGTGSILIEAKTSRRDVQKEWSRTDRDRKEFRRQLGAGHNRYYLASPGVVPDSILEESGWGLLLPWRKTCILKTDSRIFDVNYQTEVAILIRAASNSQYGKQRDPQIALRF